MGILTKLHEAGLRIVMPAPPRPVRERVHPRETLARHIRARGNAWVEWRAP